jgi:competence protein ComEC
MNITMIAGTFYLIFLFSGLRFRIASWVTVLIVIVYVGLSGAGIPIQRAGYGAVLILLAALFGRPANLLNSLCFAFFTLLLCDPKSLWNIGFQPSFLCVFSLILILPLLARVNAWTLSLGSSLAVLLGTFPVVLYYFNIFSPVSVVANLVAIPLCDAALFTALFTLLLSGVPLLNVFLIKISSWIIAGSLAWVQWLSTCRWGYWFFEKPALPLIGAYYLSLGLILFFYKRTFPARRFWLAGSLGLWLFISAAFFWKITPESFELTLLASGKNQVAHARFSNNAEWILNAGRSFPSDQGEWLIGPYLRSRGTQRLEGILFTDFSRKHTGGLVSTLRGFSVGNILYPGGNAYGSKGFYRDLSRSGRKARSLRYGDEVRMGPEKIRVVGQSQAGISLLLSSGPWRILFVSRWDDALFKYHDGGEIHAVFLPALSQKIPIVFSEWLERVRPLLVVSPDEFPGLTDLLNTFYRFKTGRSVEFQDKRPPT